MYAYWVCVALETPIFSPKFPIWSISFSQMTQYSAPEHHHFTFFAVSETIIFTISLRSSHSSPPAVGLLQPAPGVSGRPDASYSQFRRPPLSRSSLLWSPAFSRSSSVRSPAFFTLLELGRGSIPTNIWGDFAPGRLCRGTHYQYQNPWWRRPWTHARWY